MTKTPEEVRQEGDRSWARRSKYPANMGFYPLSDKFDENVPIKAPWLRPYLSRRSSLELRATQRNAVPSAREVRAVLESLGADATEHMDRYRGAMLGLAVGDALGMPLEFEPRDRRTVSDLEAGGPFRLEKGQWTDDTSMACCLAYSLIERGGFDAAHQMECYSYWYRYGAYSSNGECFDIGNTIRAAIERFLATGEAFAGSPDPKTAGNGSLMRLAPVVLFYFSDFEAVVRNAELSSRTTHQAVEAVDACRYFAALMFGALSGVDKATLLAGPYSPIPGYWERQPLCPSIDALARGSYRLKARAEISSTGYVVHTLEAALWSFANHHDFRSGALAAVNLAGDSDTVGAIYGQLAGAYYGETAIPYAWIQHITSVQGFYHFAQDLDAARPASSRVAAGP